MEVQNKTQLMHELYEFISEVDVCVCGCAQCLRRGTTIPVECQHSALGRAPEKSTRMSKVDDVEMLLLLLFRKRAAMTSRESREKCKKLKSK